MEREFLPLYPQLGLTTFSPLGGGLLTGKYRAIDKKLEGEGRYGDPATVTGHRLARLEKGVGVVDRIRPITERLGCPMAELALAWVLSNPNVSTVILGASRISQLEANFKALELIPRLTPEVLKQLDDASGTRPQPNAIAAQVRGFRSTARL